ncbi:hypothetical protein GGF44_000047 [Coemansia sp. RSA 1694]|nr:hypothetical protein GGF44_000047 [Coemansia sp. RSA 1694]
MIVSTDHSSGFVHSTSGPLQPQASTSPTTAYPSPVTADGFVFHSYYPPAVTGDRTHYYQQQHVLAPAATAAIGGGFHSRPVASGNAEEREEKRRKSHSTMERTRRQRTNNTIEMIRELIPWLRSTERLQKVEILENCVSYIKELQGKVGHAHNSLSTRNNKREWAESRAQSLDSAVAINDENAGGHRVSPAYSPYLPTRHGNRRHRSSSSSGSSSSGSGSRRRQQQQVQQHAVVTPTHAEAFAMPYAQQAESTTASLDVHAAAAAAAAAIDAVASALPLPVASSAPYPRPCTLADMPAEYWNVATPSCDSLGLMSLDSGSASRASSTYSATAPSRSQSLSTIAEAGGETSDNVVRVASGQPQAKSSIGFLTS